MFNKFFTNSPPPPNMFYLLGDGRPNGITKYNLIAWVIYIMQIHFCPHSCVKLL